MKKISYIIAILTLLAGINSCGKDNYDEPNVTLSGKITYQGQALEVKGSDEAIRLQLYQEGWEFNSPMEMFVNQHGEYSAKIYKGDYKLVVRGGDGPWVPISDTLTVKVGGNTQLDYPVTPYVLVSDGNISVSGNTVSASFTINKVTDDANISDVIIIFSNTQFADNQYNKFTKTTTGTFGSNSVTIQLSDSEAADLSSSAFLNGRIGVKSNNDHYIFTPLIKLK